MKDQRPAKLRTYKEGMLIDPLVPRMVRQVSPVVGINGFSPVYIVVSSQTFRREDWRTDNIMLPGKCFKGNLRLLPKNVGKP